VLLVALQLVLLAALGPLVAAVNVFFRDLAPGLEALLTLLFYVTPIIYPLERVPDGIKPLLYLNPMVPIVDAWRDLFLDGDLPGLALWPAALFTAVAVALALAVTRATAKSLADAL
jgi:lipopolysaccharide transport system permease protein